MGMLDILLTTLLVVAIVIGLQAVGVVLMSAMLVAPAAAARQWTDRLGVMVLLSSFFGSAGRCNRRCHQQRRARLLHRSDCRVMRRGHCAVLDAFRPQSRLDLELGPPERNQRKLNMQAVLRDLFYMENQHVDSGHTHSLQALEGCQPGGGGVRSSLQALERRGLVRQTGASEWALTSRGIDEAHRLLREME